MEKFLIIFLLLLVVPAIGFAYSDPTGPPPADNTPPPLNISTQPQSKAGDLGGRNFRANGGVVLGGIFHDSWLRAGSTCAWEGTKCYCASDDSSIGFIKIMLAVACRGGKVINFGIKELNFSSRTGFCPAEAPAGCDGGYGFKGASAAKGSAVMRTLKAGVAVFDNYVVRTVRWVGKAFRIIKGWF